MLAHRSLPLSAALLISTAVATAAQERGIRRAPDPSDGARPVAPLPANPRAADPRLADVPVVSLEFQPSTGPRQAQGGYLTDADRRRLLSPAEGQVRSGRAATPGASFQTFRLSARDNYMPDRAAVGVAGFDTLSDVINLGEVGDAVGFHINFVQGGRYLFDCVVSSDPATEAVYQIYSGPTTLLTEIHLPAGRTQTNMRDGIVFLVEPASQGWGTLVLQTTHVGATLHSCNVSSLQ